MNRVTINVRKEGIAWPRGGLLNMLPVGSSCCFSSTENDDYADVRFLANRSEFNSKRLPFVCKL